MMIEMNMTDKGLHEERNRHRAEYSEEEFHKKLEELTSKDIAVFDEIGSLPIKNFHSDTYIVLLCLEGKGTCKMEGKTYEVGKHDLVIGHPDLFIEDAMVSLDFKCEGLVMSPSYFESIFFLGGNHWEAVMAIKKQPVIHLTEEEVRRSVFDFMIIRRKLADTFLPHYEEMIRLMMHSLIYEFYDCLSPKLNMDIKEYNYSAPEILFKRFVQLMADESPYRHEVGYYADKLCVSRKYLTSVCKQQSGKTPSDLINDITTNYIKQMLHSSDKTIKEIAADTGFCNLSFFGKYVRRELGMSPREYRQKGE